MEVRRIPVRSEDAPDIMQPGWTKHYREEREKIIKECMEDEVQKKRGSRKTSKEMELKNMASVSQDKLAGKKCSCASIQPCFVMASVLFFKFL